MSNYYFLASALPPLQLEGPPEMSFLDLIHLLRDNLSVEDFAKTQVLRRFYDIRNTQAFWKEEPLEIYGNYNAQELEEALLARIGLPEYLYDFLDRYESKSDRLHYFSGLLVRFFQIEQKQASGFLKEYLRFEHQLRLTLVGFRAKQLGRNLAEELQFEDPNDDFVAQMLAQKDSKNFIPSDRFEDLIPILEENWNNPLALYQALAVYRFRKIEEMLNVDLFSIDRILGYMAQLVAKEQWFALNKERGMELVDRAIRIK